MNQSNTHYNALWNLESSIVLVIFGLCVIGLFILVIICQNSVLCGACLYIVHRASTYVTFDWGFIFIDE